MILELTDCTVTLVDNLTWGKKEEINAALLSGVKVGATQRVDFDAQALSLTKYKAIEVCTVKVTKDGKDMPFTREWLNNLTIEDGDKLYEAVEELTTPKKV